MKTLHVGLAVVFCIFVFMGCATPYQRMGLTGGYSDVRLDNNTFRLEFRGNAYTSRQTVQNYLLYRCAELTIESGHDYFVIITADNEAQQGVYTTPGTMHSTTRGSASVYGNTAYGSAYTTGTYSPGQTFYYTKHSASALIKVYKGEKPADNPMAFNAHELKQYMGPSLQTSHRCLCIP